MLEIGVEWIRRLGYVCGCERDRERVHVSHIQIDIRENEIQRDGVLCLRERKIFHNESDS